MGAPVPLGGGSSRPLLLPPHGDEDQGKALGPCMPASFASTQLESDRCRFENPLRFRRMGNCSSSDQEAAWPIHRHEENLREQFERDAEEYKIKAASHGAQKRKIEGDKKLTREQR